MERSKTFQRRVTAVVAVLVGLIASMMVALPGEASTDLCPKGGDGWIKIDKSSGTRTGAFGTFS